MSAPQLSPEQEAGMAGNNLLQQSTQRKLDVIDCLEIEADIIDKILEMLQEVMFRLRDVEAVCLDGTPAKSNDRGYCGLNCANNTFAL
jgi:hypothetical protein